MGCPRSHKTHPFSNWWILQWFLECMGVKHPFRESEFKYVDWSYKGNSQPLVMEIRMGILTPWGEFGKHVLTVDIPSLKKSMQANSSTVTNSGTQPQVGTHHFTRLGSPHYRLRDYVGSHEEGDHSRSTQVHTNEAHEQFGFFLHCTCRARVKP